MNLYDTPQITVVKLVLEQSVLQSSGDPDITNPDMGWDN